MVFAAGLAGHRGAHAAFLADEESPAALDPSPVAEAMPAAHASEPRTEAGPLWGSLSEIVDPWQQQPAPLRLEPTKDEIVDPWNDSLVAARLGSSRINVPTERGFDEPPPDEPVAALPDEEPSAGAALALVPGKQELEFGLLNPWPVVPPAGSDYELRELVDPWVQAD